MIRNPEALTAEAFAPFGDVIEVDPSKPNVSINYGNTQRFHDLAKVDVANDGGRAGISIFRSKPLPLPIHIRLLERHPLSSQAFFPLSPKPYLIVVAPPGDLDRDCDSGFSGPAVAGGELPCRHLAPFLSGSGGGK